MELSFYSLDSSNLTKAQLAEILFEQLGLNKREAKDFIDAFFEIISAQLADGQDVRISGFGSYESPRVSWRPVGLS
jgi:integration host factor subunit alpha